MKKITLILGLLLSQLNTLSHAEINTNTTKATATLSATCSIPATSISFGALATPLFKQSASSTMTVLCSREAAYKIDLAFGGVYGTGAPGDGSYWVFANSPNNYTYYYIHYSATGQYIENRKLSTPTNYQTQLGCATRGGERCYTGSTAYDYGMMKGGVKGDTVAYTVFIPGDSSKVWNSGKNSYSSTGTGSHETISLNAQIVPAQSSAFPTPDFYSDTIVATISY